MGRGRHLSDYEKGQIDALLSSKMSYNVIEKAIKLFKTAVGNYFRAKNVMRRRREGRGQNSCHLEQFVF